jgi:hypothetical protein
MKGTLPLASGVAAALAIATYSGPAQADTKLSGAELVPAVTQAKDVRVFARKVKNSDKPQPGTGADHVPSQGICFTATGTIASLNKLPKRQAWSTQLIGKGETKGVITIVNQYKSAKQAKAKLEKVKALLAGCPADVVDGTRTIEQSSAPLPTMYRGRAVFTATVVKDTGGQDSVQYVAIRQTGALLSFVRYSQAFEGAQPGSTQFAGMVEFLSGKVAERYKALQQS